MKSKFIGVGILILFLVIMLLVFSFPRSEVKDLDTNIIWSKTFGGDSDDLGSFVLYTSDEGCIVTGYTKSYGSGEADLWLIKTNSIGDKLWIKTFGGSDYEEGKCVEELSDGGYAVIGKTKSFGQGKNDIWLIRIDKSGNELWNKTFGGSGFEEGNSIKKTDDGGYILAGDTTSYSTGDYDAWLIKVDESGNEEWNASFGGINSDAGRSIEKCSDGGYILAGETGSFGAGGTDIWIIKVDELGNEEWNVTVGSEKEEYCNQIISVNDGFLVAGHNITIDGYNVSLNGFIVKIDVNGTVIWQTVISEEKSAGTSSIDVLDDGYLFGGFIGEGDDSDFFVGKMDFSGNVIWTDSVGGKYSDTGIWIERGASSDFFVAGHRDLDGSGDQDLWILKMNAFD